MLQVFALAGNCYCKSDSMDWNDEYIALVCKLFAQQVLIIMLLNLQVLFCDSMFSKQLENLISSIHGQKVSVT